MEPLDRPYRQPSEIPARLIDSGIASLTAGVLLIYDAKVPDPNIHILDLYAGSGGGMNPYGDATDCYFLPFECYPHFHACMERHLCLVPDQKGRCWM